MKLSQMTVAALFLALSFTASADCGGELELMTDDYKFSTERLGKEQPFFGEQTLSEVLATILPY